MKAYWLNKNNKKKVIVFFAGWSFDNFPFEKMLCADEYDVLMLYDYNDMSLPEDLNWLEGYEEKILLTWSMGVFAAYLNKDMLSQFDYKIALNGTITPVDDKFGIPVKIFELTLKHATTGLGGKFYKNVFSKDEEYQKYELSPVQRSIENRVSELENLYELIKKQPLGFDNVEFYDFAIVCEGDKIIPPLNQLASHKKNNVPVITLPYGHFPFYNFSKWDEIVKLCQ